MRATNITVTFPQLSGKTAIKTTQHFVIPDAKNIEGTLGAAYDPTSDTPYYKIGGSNIAMIKLSDPLTIDGSNVKTKLDFYIFLKHF